MKKNYADSCNRKGRRTYLSGTVGCLLATQEMMENCTKKNCFELYGADFMLTQDLKVGISTYVC